MRPKRTASALLLRNLGPGLLFVRPRWPTSLFGDDAHLAPAGPPPENTLTFEVPPGATYLADPGDIPKHLPANVLLECFAPQQTTATLAWAPDVYPESVPNMRFAFLSPTSARPPPPLAYENGQA